MVIGRDTRQSGPMLESALISGVCSAGGRAELVGVLPTPGVAYFTRVVEADAGIMVSASHNPYQDNGIKVFSGSGFKLSDQEEARVESMVGSGEARGYTMHASQEGRAQTMVGAAERYIGFLQDTLAAGLSLKGMKVALDTANGATSEIAPAVFSGLGAEVLVIHDRPDGVNINEGCGSEHTEDLRKLVTESGADLGLAFDGDGDRLMAVDERGRGLTGDQTLVVCADMLKTEGLLQNDQIVSTIMSNVGLTAACKRLGLKNFAADVGDRHVLEQMQRLGAVLGGEASGHVVFLGHHTTGDGILTGVQLTAAMLRAGKALSDLADLMEVFPQTLINVEVKSKPELGAVSAVAEAIKQAESELGDEGRVLVRYSGTQNLCRVMVEGSDADTTKRLAEMLAKAVEDSLGREP